MLYTVGHGTRSIEDLIAVLTEAGVIRLIDVRRYPASRRHPQFGREALEPRLTDAGLAYEWWGEALGGRRSRNPAGSRHPAWREPAFQGYADHMDTTAFRDAMQRLEAGTVPTALMCAETLWWKCHRRLIADALAARSSSVEHLLGPGQREPHRLHPALRVGADGWPIYDRVDGMDPLFD